MRARQGRDDCSGRAVPGRLLDHRRSDAAGRFGNALTANVTALLPVPLSLPDAPVWLLADPGRLEQVFVNLLANASKYTDTGGELTVGGHVEDGLAVVLVRDTGVGIAPEVLPHLFDLFWQADAAASRAPSGLGIGLALVRNLVESHGGIVTAQSGGPGQGSEFTVYLPIGTCGAASS